MLRYRALDMPCHPWSITGHKLTSRRYSTKFVMNLWSMQILSRKSPVKRLRKNPLGPQRPCGPISLLWTLGELNGLFTLQETTRTKSKAICDFKRFLGPQHSAIFFYRKPKRTCKTNQNKTSYASMLVLIYHDLPTINMLKKVMLKNH